MNRRSFVLSSVLGLAGIIESNATSAFGGKSCNTEHFELFARTVGDYSIPQELNNDPSLEKVLAYQSAPLDRLGYRKTLSGLFFCDDDNTMFVPFQLKKADKVLDLAVLFFSKNKEGNWLFDKTYSGFHLEVFAHLIHEFKPLLSIQELADLLLPAYRNGRSTPSDIFYTRSAQIKFQVRIIESGTLIDYQILENQKIAMVNRRVSTNWLTDNIV